MLQVSCIQILCCFGHEVSQMRAQLVHPATSQTILIQSILLEVTVVELLHEIIITHHYQLNGIIASFCMTYSVDWVTHQCQYIYCIVYEY